QEVVEAGEQGLSQRDAAHRAMLGYRITLLRQHHLALEREQHPHLLGQETPRAARLAASAVEDVEQLRRQAGVERAAAGRIDVHAIALHPIGEGAVALVDRDAHAGLLEPLREAKTADA